VPVLEVNGGPLAYDDEGAGPPVVLLHAGIADRLMWTPLVRLMAPHHRMIAYDLRGYGESTPPPPSFAHHDDVAGLLDGLGIERAALVGCSFGGRVAVDAALAYPDRVGALALIGAVVSGYHLSESDELWERLVGEVAEDDLDAYAAGETRFWVVGPERTPAEVDPGLLAYAAPAGRRALAAEDALARLDVKELEPPALDRLGEVTVPALVAVGAGDIPEIRRLADRLAAGIPHARRLPDIPDAAHLVPLERPDAVAAALLEFLG
jgi:pimeloyl-ACP methyl ester carboxylesterase